MGNLARPIMWASVILAIGIFLSAQRIAYVMSFEGKWDSCHDTLKKNNRFSWDDNAITSVCIKMIGGN
jgi:hypothetical protein